MGCGRWKVRVKMVSWVLFGERVFFFGLKISKVYIDE